MLHKITEQYTGATCCYNIFLQHFVTNLLPRTFCYKSEQKLTFYRTFVPKYRKIYLIFPFCNIFKVKNVTKHFHLSFPSDPYPVRLTKRKNLEFQIFVTFLQNQNDTELSLIFRQKLSFVTFVTRFWKNFYIIFIFRLFYIYNI